MILLLRLRLVFPLCHPSFGGVQVIPVGRPFYRTAPTGSVLSLGGVLAWGQMGLGQNPVSASWTKVIHRPSQAYRLPKTI
jgi:hypothetical protein